MPETRRDHPAGLELVRKEIFEEWGWPSLKVYDFDAERWGAYAIMKVKDNIHFIR